MPFYLIFFLVVAFLGTLSLKWKQRWLATQDPTSELTATQPPAEPTTPLLFTPLGRVTQGFSDLRNKLPFGSTQPNLSQRFRAWTAIAFAQDENVQTWLAALSPGAHTAFTNQVAEFCNEMGFDLAALVDGQLAEIPATAQQAETIVLQYCRANQQAALAQDDFDAANRFLAYLRAPAHKSNLAFGQKLYSKLIEAEIVPPPSFDLLLAAEEIRRTNALAAIHQAAAQNPVAFNTVLKIVMLEGTALSPQEMSQTTPSTPIQAQPSVTAFQSTHDPHPVFDKPAGVHGRHGHEEEAG